MFVISQSLTDTVPSAFVIAVKNTWRFIIQLFFVLTDHCVECGKTMDEQASYGIRCMTCEDAVIA